jgi:ATP-dependent DNA ligase
MLAALHRALPGEGYVYEPKWDGFRALVYLDGEELDLRSRNDRDLGRYFPELVAAFRSLGEARLVLDGEIVVVGPSGLDFAALMTRLHPSASRVKKLATETPACFIAFDLVAVGDEDLRATPYIERRARLERLLEKSASPHLAVTPATWDVARARAWFEGFHGGGVDGVVAKDPRSPYTPGQRTMIKVKRARTLDCVVAGFRTYGSEPMIGSLLLGIYDDDGALVHVGVTSQFTTRQRRELLRDVWPLVTELAGHPWEHGFGLERSPLGRLKGAAGRWSPDMEPDWVPLRPERVVEVAYDTIDDRRLRYPARFVRFREDRDPRSCRFDQLPEGAPDIRALLAP